MVRSCPRPALRGRLATLTLSVATVVGGCAVVPWSGVVQSAAPPSAVGPPPASGGSSVAPLPTLDPSATFPPSDGSAAPAASRAPTPSPTATPIPATPPPVIPTRRITSRLQQLLDEFVARETAPGIQATVIFPDGTTWTGASGVAHVGGPPVTADTAFAVASISKTFLAALVLELSREGHFGLEDQVTKYLPELKLDPAITIRMLLDHTSGLFDFFEHRLIDSRLQGRPATRWPYQRALGYVEAPYFDPGTNWHYSNTNYLVLGLLAERVTGRRLAVELRERFLEPLGLESMWYQDVEKRLRPLAHGHRLVPRGDALAPQDLSDGTGVVPFRSVVSAAGGAGSLAGDSRDVARWARALYGGEAIDEDSLRIMLAGVDAVAGYRPRIPYGLGVQAIEIAGHRTFGHSGRFLGFRGQMRWLPDDEIAIGVLTNQSRSDISPLVARIVKVLLPAPDGCRCPDPR
jgi:D-alanyl-D-alanine carboxypeptidase